MGPLSLALNRFCLQLLQIETCSARPYQIMNARKFETLFKTCNHDMEYVLTWLIEVFVPKF